LTTRIRPVSPVAACGRLRRVNAEERLTELGLELPSAPRPLASYVPVVISGGFAFVAGQVPLSEGKLMWEGKVGLDLDLRAGAEAARRCGLQALAVLREALGSLDRVRRIVRLSVFVASEPGFTAQPKVADGASDLMQEVFGEAGRHARTSVGVLELPLGAPVEVDLVAEIEA
jgi:enamine deaminase RidA (YjgF/YER057c/UK114 family)